MLQGFWHFTFIKIQKHSERRSACWKPPLKSWNEFRNTKLEKTTSQFFQSVGRCEEECTQACPQAPLGCPLPANPPARLLVFKVIRGNGFKMNSQKVFSILLGKNNLIFFPKNPSFLGNHSKYMSKQQLRPRQPPWAGSQGQGMPAYMLPWPWQPPWASNQGQGSPHGQATKTKAHNQGQGMPTFACMDRTTFLFIKGQIYVSIW